MGDEIFCSVNYLNGSDKNKKWHVCKTPALMGTFILNAIASFNKKKDAKKYLDELNKKWNPGFILIWSKKELLNHTCE